MGSPRSRRLSLETATSNRPYGRTSPVPSRIRRRVPYRRASVRRRTQWVDATGDFAALPVGDFTNIDLLQTYRSMVGAETVGISVIRTHLRVWVTSSIVAGDGIAIGLGVDDTAEVIGATALGTAHAWNPVDQPYLRWMLYQRFNAHPQYDFHGGTSGNLEFDLRTKRRVPFGDTLLLSLVNIDASAAVSWSWHARTLIALS